MEKIKIAILGDSLTYGYLPYGNGTINRENNWPKLLENKISNHYQQECEVFINALPGRTITKPIINFDFPQDNGMDNLNLLFRQFAPFDLFIVFLGTNDYFAYKFFKEQFSSKSFDFANQIASSLDVLIEKMREIYLLNNMQPKYKTLVISPPLLNTYEDNSAIRNLYQAYKNQLADKNIPILNMQEYVNPISEDGERFDGVHYVESQSEEIAQTIFNFIIDQNVL